MKNLVNKFQLIEYLNSLIKAVSQDEIESGRVSFSKEGEQYKVQFHLGNSRSQRVRECTEDGIFARVRGVDLKSNPYPHGSNEATCWENGWKLEHARRLGPENLPQIINTEV